jgi:hypothetical protein
MTIAKEKIMDLTRLYSFIEAEGKIQLSEGFKKTLEETFSVALSEKQTALDEATAKIAELEADAATKSAEITKLQENTMEDVKKAVDEYKDQLVEKISSYLDVELERMIPEDIAEKVAKAEIYEPLVEGFKATVNRYGIEFESEGHALLKEAKEEILKLRGELDETIAKTMEMTSEMAKKDAVLTLMEKMEGLTDDQQKKIVTIFKGKSADEINERFNEVRDLIIGAPKTDEPAKEAAPAETTVVVEKVEAPAAPAVVKEAVEDLGQRLL